VACIDDNYESIAEDRPDALNAQHRSGRTPADPNQGPQYSSKSAGWAAANKPRGPKRSTLAGNPACHLETQSQHWDRVLQSSLCRWQHQALQTGISSMACRLPTSAMTPVCFRNARVFRMALMALMDPRTLWPIITRFPSPRRRVMLLRCLVYFVVNYTHHQEDPCVTILAGSAVMLKPYTQHLGICMPFSSRVPHFTCPLLLYIGCRTIPIYVQFWDVVTYHNTVFASDTSLAVAFASPLSYFTNLKYTVQSSQSLVLCTQSSTFCVDPSSACDTSSSSSAPSSSPCPIITLTSTMRTVRLILSWSIIS